MKQLTKTFIKSQETGIDKILVGLVSYSGTPKIDFLLRDSQSRDRLIAKLDSMQFEQDVVNIDRALKLARDEVFSSANGGRLGIPKIIILFTDNAADTYPKEISKEIINTGIKLVAVGIGDDVDKKELDRLANGNAVSVELPINEGELNEIIQTINGQIYPGKSFSSFSLVFRASFLVFPETGKLKYFWEIFI